MMQASSDSHTEFLKTGSFLIRISFRKFENQSLPDDSRKRNQKHLTVFELMRRPLVMTPRRPKA